MYCCWCLALNRHVHTQVHVGLHLLRQSWARLYFLIAYTYAIIDFAIDYITFARIPECIDSPAKSDEQS